MTSTTQTGKVFNVQEAEGVEYVVSAFAVAHLLIVLSSLVAHQTTAAEALAHAPTAAEARIIENIAEQEKAVAKEAAEIATVHSKGAEIASSPATVKEKGEEMVEQLQEKTNEAVAQGQNDTQTYLEQAKGIVGAVVEGVQVSYCFLF